MSISQSFDAVATPNACVLILGSMPGVESLKAEQYYAHPRNAFWNIMGELFGINRTLPYPVRLTLLKQSHVALWDVAHRCERPGSLDSRINTASIEANNFAAFFNTHPDIQAVCFNGRKAEQIYRRMVLPVLDGATASIPLYGLPSTSPAHAAMSYEQKLTQWLIIHKIVATVEA